MADDLEDRHHVSAADGRGARQERVRDAHNVDAQWELPVSACQQQILSDVLHPWQTAAHVEFALVFDLIVHHLPHVILGIELGHCRGQGRYSDSRHSGGSCGGDHAAFRWRISGGQHGRREGLHGRREDR